MSSRTRDHSTLMSFDAEDALDDLARRTTDRLAALTGDYSGIVAASKDSNADDEHDPEGVTIGFERAQLLGLLGGAREEIAALDRAAARLRAGTYGRCLTCGREIPDNRLEALPAAETCLDCAGKPRRRR